MTSSKGKLSLKYAGSMAAIALVFGNFVACGSQFYQVSVEEDFTATAATQAANPDMNDPKSTLYGIHAPSGWQTLPIPFRFGKDMDNEQKLHFLAAIKTWEKAVGMNLFSYAGTHELTNGDTFKDLYSSLNDTINGQYLDGNWRKTDKPNFVLATTIWNNGLNDPRQIAKADIRFNNEHYLIGDSLVISATDDKEVVDMQSLALHELGHLLGLAHVDVEVDSLSIMNPSLFIGEGLTSRRISKGDIERIQQIYGCDSIACDVDSIAETLEVDQEGESSTQTAQLWLDSQAEQYND